MSGKPPEKLPEKVKGTTAGELGATWVKPSYVVGEGYPKGIVWIDKNDKNDSTIMIVNTGDNEYQLHVRHVLNNVYTKWEHVTSFHDYELEELAISILEGAVKDDIIISKVMNKEWQR
jgi:hypothetical protein